MRMWLIDPKILCQKHLCGEHVEMHMFLGTLKKKIKVSGYINNNLFEPKVLKSRHDELANEMILRGYKHKTPLDITIEQIQYLPNNEKEAKINKVESFKELIKRCDICNSRFLKTQKL